MTGGMDPDAIRALNDAADRLYAGSRAPVRALHDAVLELTRALGDDVTVRVGSGRVEVLRRTVFLDLAPGPDDTLRVGVHYRDDAAGDVPDVLDAEPAHVVHLDWDALDQDVIALEPLIETAYDQHA